MGGFERTRLTEFQRSSCADGIVTGGECRGNRQRFYNHGVRKRWMNSLRDSAVFSVVKSVYVEKHEQRAAICSVRMHRSLGNCFCSLRECRCFRNATDHERVRCILSGKQVISERTSMRVDPSVNLRSEGDSVQLVLEMWKAHCHAELDVQYEFVP